MHILAPQLYAIRWIYIATLVSRYTTLPMLPSPTPLYTPSFTLALDKKPNQRHIEVTEDLVELTGIGLLEEVVELGDELGNNGLLMH